MTWYAMYKWFTPWRKTPYVNFIKWYKKYLYDTWLNSLSDEERKKILKEKEQKELQRKQQLKNHLESLNTAINYIANQSSGFYLH